MYVMDIENSVIESAKALGYDSLKDEQRRAVEAFLSGKPTGFGKSIIIICCTP